MYTYIYTYKYRNKNLNALKKSKGFMMFHAKVWTTAVIMSSLPFPSCAPLGRPDPPSSSQSFTKSCPPPSGHTSEWPRQRRKTSRVSRSWERHHGLKFSWNSCRLPHSFTCYTTLLATICDILCHSYIRSIICRASSGCQALALAGPAIACQHEEPQVKMPRTR